MSNQCIIQNGTNNEVEQGYWFDADTKRYAECSTISGKQKYLNNRSGMVVVSQKIEHHNINPMTTGNNRGGEHNPITQWGNDKHTNRVEFWITGPEYSQELLEGLGIDIEICLTIQDGEKRTVYGRTLLIVNGRSDDVIVNSCGVGFFAYFTPSDEEIQKNREYKILSAIDPEEAKHHFRFTVRCKMYAL